MKKLSLKYGEFTDLKRVFLTSENGLPVESVNSIAFSGDDLYITAEGSLYRYAGGELKKLPLGADKIIEVGGSVYICKGNSLYIMENENIREISEFDAPVIDISIGLDDSFWLITEKTLYLKTEGGFSEICGLPENTACLAAVDNKSKYDESVYIGSKTDGFMSLKGKRRHWGELLPDNSGCLSNSITAVKRDVFGYLWVASKKGVNVYDGRSVWFSGKDVFSVPDGSFNDIYFAPDGKKYFAADTGLIILSEGKLNYYSYGVWLKHPKVTLVSASKNGAVAAVTPRGISVITPVVATLEKKAEYYDKMAEKYYVRKDGYCVLRRLKKQGDLDSGVLENTDNDGLFTGLYCASQCFRYKATGDPRALANAKRSLYALIKLTEVSGKKGFIARAIRYKDEHNYGTGNREEWCPCENDPDCEWLGETSSDEVTGHFYAYGIYYDLVADDEDKKKIAETVKNVIDHIIENDFHLSDVDNIPTTWANWNPASLNGDDRWFYERGTNSLEILSFLKTAFHVTGDKKYDDIFNMLIKKHHYGMNVMRYKAEDAHIGHIDDQLDFANIYALIKYTDDEAQKEIFKMGLTHHFAYERVERSPWFNITYGALTGQNCDIEAAAKGLSEMTLDLVRYPAYNSYRKDIVWDDEQEKIGLPKQLKYPVEYYNRPMHHYDGNPFLCDAGCEEFVETYKSNDNRLAFLPGSGGADGMSAVTPYVYLLPYWMARYYNLLED